jgi:hypothetical protein
MKTIKWKYFIAILIVGLLILTLRPVPIPNEKECLITKGKVIKIFAGGVKDVVFDLQGIKKVYYINRGLERGLDLQKLKDELMNNEVIIKYPRHWTPLDPTNYIKHISKIEFKGKTIFTEID